MSTKLIDNKTLLVLTATVLEKLSDGDKKHPLRAHITVKQAEKYRKAIDAR